MIHRNMALVSGTGEYSPSQLSALAAALSIQLTRDVSGYWGHSANVQYFPGSAPAGYWKLQIESNIDQPGAAGYHTDEAGQPYALIQYTGDFPTDSLTVSHEAVEMLIDPFGSWLAAPVTAHLIGQMNPGASVSGAYVQVLLEDCDPCEASSYTINGVTVSDFALPAYFRESGSGLGQYTHMGGRTITGPFQVAPDGYLSWLNLSDNHWYQLTNFGSLQVSDLGPNSKEARAGRTIREWVDAWSRGNHKRLGKKA